MQVCLHKSSNMLDFLLLMLCDFFFYFTNISRETKWLSCGTLSSGTGAQLFIPRLWAFFRSAQQSVFSLKGIIHLPISRYTFHIQFAYCTILGCKDNKMDALSSFYWPFYLKLTPLVQGKRTEKRITKLLHFVFQKNENDQTSASDTLYWKASSSSLYSWISSCARGGGVGRENKQTKTTAWMFNCLKRMVSLLYIVLYLKRGKDLMTKLFDLSKGGKCASDFFACEAAKNKDCNEKP